MVELGAEMSVASWSLSPNWSWLHREIMGKNGLTSIQVMVCRRNGLSLYPPALEIHLLIIKNETEEIKDRESWWVPILGLLQGWMNFLSCINLSIHLEIVLVQKMIHGRWSIIHQYFCANQNAEVSSWRKFGM